MFFTTSYENGRNYISHPNSFLHNATAIRQYGPNLNDSGPMEDASFSLGNKTLLSVNSSSLESLNWTHCFFNWNTPNHALFQIANSFIFLSFLAPVGLHGLLYLRSCLMLSAIFFSLWGWIILCAFDTFLWNAIFTFFNLIHISVLLYMLRPVKFSSRLEDVYKNLFQPLRVSRHHFSKVVRCMREIKSLKPKDPYCVENVTKADRLSLVLSGRLVVSQYGRPLHIVDSKQFLDSAEWFGVCTNDTYQVSITALEECQVLIWNRDKLKLSISNDQFLQAVFDNILGKDVVKKLLNVTETSCNGNGFYVCEDVVAETTKLLAKNKNKAGQTGLGVLLTRQVKNRDTNVWTLAKKGQGDIDTETSV